MRGPDFICMGAHRTGSTWLCSVLSSHPQLWLSPIKELHYFDRESHRRAHRKLQKVRLLSETDHAFTWYERYWYERYFLHRPDDMTYCQLFMDARKRGLITGECTPGYAVLDDIRMQKIRSLNQNVKIIFIMRDPVYRAWSAVMYFWEKNKLTNSIPSTKEALALAFTPEVLARSTYIDTVKKIDRIFPSSSVFYNFYENLIDNPELFVRSILDHLGVDSSIASKLVTLPATKSTSNLASIPRDFERAYAERILPSVERLCDRFEGHPHLWRKRYLDLL